MNSYALYSGLLESVNIGIYPLLVPPLCQQPTLITTMHYTRLLRPFEASSNNAQT